MWGELILIFTPNLDTNDEGKSRLFLSNPLDSRKAKLLKTKTVDSKLDIKQNLPRSLNFQVIGLLRALKSLKKISMQPDIELRKVEKYFFPL